MKLWFLRHFSGIRKLVATGIWSPRVHLVSCTFTVRASTRTRRRPCSAYGKQRNEGMSTPRGLSWSTTTRWSFLPSVLRFPKGECLGLFCVAMPPPQMVYNEEMLFLTFLEPTSLRSKFWEVQLADEACISPEGGGAVSSYSGCQRATPPPKKKAVCSLL